MTSHNVLPRPIYRNGVFRSHASFGPSRRRRHRRVSRPFLRGVLIALLFDVAIIIVAWAFVEIARFLGGFA